MQIFISDALWFSVKFESQVSRWENVKSCWSSVLNDKGWLLGFSDYSAESGEWVSDGFYVNVKFTIRSFDGQFHLLLFCWKHEGHWHWLSEDDVHHSVRYHDLFFCDLIFYKIIQNIYFLFTLEKVNPRLRRSLKFETQNLIH